MENIEKALQLRNILRWNGRDLRDKENVAEHVHLAINCAMYLYDTYGYEYRQDLNFEKFIKAVTYIDNVVINYGELSALTKQIGNISNIYNTIKWNELHLKLNEIEKTFVKLSHLMATYKFIEWQLHYPNNSFLQQAYHQTKEAYEKLLKTITKTDIVIDEPIKRFVKGYQADAGIDVILDKSVTFMPLSSQVVNLNINCTPSENQMSYLCARTSAASKGLIVAQCPIDPNFTGEVSAIVHNVSNDIITYDIGEAFCQIVTVPINHNVIKDIYVKKTGKRSDGKIGSTGGVKC